MGKGQDNFNAVLVDGDEYLQTLIARLHVEKTAMVGTLAAITKRMIQIVPQEEGMEPIYPQTILTSITRDFELELCMRSMEEIDPNWKVKALAEMAKDPERLAEVLNEVAGRVPDHIIEQVRDEVAKVGNKPTIH